VCDGGGSCLLLDGGALQSVHHLQAAVALAPVDAEVLLGAAGGAGAQGGGGQAEAGPHHAVVQGQSVRDALCTLAHGQRHAARVAAAAVT